MVHSHGFRRYCIHEKYSRKPPALHGSHEPRSCATPSHLGSALDVIFALALRAKSHVALSPPARHSRQAYPSQGPRAPRPHSNAHSYSTERNRGSGGASSSYSPAPACLPGLAPCLPPACRPRHCVQARDHLWYGREDHDRHTAATRCANPTRDHPRLCARHDRCRQPSATSPISQDTRLR